MSTDTNDKNPAADLVREKLDKLFSDEPNAADEAAEALSTPVKRSKHQQFMYDLSTSGKPIVQVQTEWHDYYAKLPDHEKHDVWQEFYAANKNQQNTFKAMAEPAGTPAAAAYEKPLFAPDQPQASVDPGIRAPEEPRNSVADIKRQITGKVRVRGKLSRKQHLQSLGFGLGMGALVVIILLFGFFNERFIAPFITPSRTVSATPLIVDPNNNATVDASPQLIIPKINVQTPVVYNVPTIEEKDVQAGLENGIVHYITTSNPGEQGNAVFFGHSSSNILNRGRYKYALVLLSWMEKDDTFYIQKDGKRYVYKVFEKKVIKPTDVSVLNPIEGHIATATLITCDPPGTNVNRMVIIGDQISPDPNTAVASSAKATEKPAVLAGNSESLWHRITHAFSN